MRDYTPKFMKKSGVYMLIYGFKQPIGTTHTPS